MTGAKRPDVLEFAHTRSFPSLLIRRRASEAQTIRQTVSPRDHARSPPQRPCVLSVLLRKATSEIRLVRLSLDRQSGISGMVELLQATRVAPDGVMSERSRAEMGVQRSTGQRRQIAVGDLAGLLTTTAM